METPGSPPDLKPISWESARLHPYSLDRYRFAGVLAFGRLQLRN